MCNCLQADLGERYCGFIAGTEAESGPISAKFGPISTDLISTEFGHSMTCAPGMRPSRGLLPVNGVVSYHGRSAFRGRSTSFWSEVPRAVRNIVRECFGSSGAVPDLRLTLSLGPPLIGCRRSVQACARSRHQAWVELAVPHRVVAAASVWPCLGPQGRAQARPRMAKACRRNLIF